MFLWVKYVPVCPYYGVDENYNGYCKKDHNSYRERFAPCNMEGSNSAPSASAPASSAPTLHKEPRTCTSSCPYYGVDADYNGYCRKDHNSYRERFSTCNMGEYILTSGGGGGGGGGTVYENVPILGSMDGVWRPGIHPEFPDFDTLVRSYYAYFADDLAARYLRDKIALINAKMYYTTYPGTGDEGVKSTVSYAVETEADGYTVKVTANYYRDYDNPDQITDTQYFNFPLRKEDGAWVFTKMQWIPT